MQEAPLGYQIAGMAIAGLCGFAVGRDAREQKRSLSESWTWGLGIFLALILVLPVYLFMRYKIWPTETKGSPGSPKVTGTCRYCGVLIEDNPIYCPSCSMQLRGAESVHGKK